MRAHEGERCPACTAPGRRLSLLIDRRYQLYRCRGCKTEFFRFAAGVGDVRTDSEYWEAHKVGFYSDREVQAAFARRYDALLEAATARAGPIGSVLDVGCGTGNFLRYAQDRGLDAVGVDLDAGAVREARDRGLAAFPLADLGVAVAAGPFDAITLWDVVEHIIDPVAALEPLLAQLRPGGLLIFETPDGGFPIRRLILALHAASRARVDLTPPLYYWEHKVYFTEAGFRAMMHRLGCELVLADRATSVREKMSAVFAYEADRRGTVLDRALHRSWPLLERVSSRVHLGNKLLVIGRKRGDRPRVAHAPLRRGERL